MKKLVVSLLAAGLVLPSAAALAEENKPFHLYSDQAAGEVRNDLNDIQVKLTAANAARLAADKARSEVAGGVVAAEAKLAEAQTAKAAADSALVAAESTLANVQAAGEAGKNTLPKAQKRVKDAAAAVEAAAAAVKGAEAAVASAKAELPKLRAAAEKAYREAVAVENNLRFQLLERAKWLTDDERKGLPADVKEALAADKNAGADKKDESVNKAVDKAKAAAKSGKKAGKKALPKTSAAK